MALQLINLKTRVQTQVITYSFNVPGTGLHLEIKQYARHIYIYFTELTICQETYLKRQQCIMIGEIHGAVFLGAKQGFQSDLKPKSK